MTSTTEDQVVTLHGTRELFERAGHLFDARTELVCAAEDTSTWKMSGRQDTMPEQMRVRLAAGLSVHKLYNPKAVADPAAARELAELAEVGVRIRICVTELPHETIIIDRQVAITAGAMRNGLREYSVVRSPGVVAAMRSLYATTWRSAIELTTFLRDRVPMIGADGLAILRTLGAGRKDESAARELGMSVRTYRRRVAELMLLLGADSRFQAGLRARDLGLQL